MSGPGQFDAAAIDAATRRLRATAKAVRGLAAQRTEANAAFDRLLSATPATGEPGGQRTLDAQLDAALATLAAIDGEIAALLTHEAAMLAENSLS